MAGPLRLLPVRHGPSESIAARPMQGEQGYGVREGRPSRRTWNPLGRTAPHGAADGGGHRAQVHRRAVLEPFG